MRFFVTGNEMPVIQGSGPLLSKSIHVAVLCWSRLVLRREVDCDILYVYQGRQPTCGQSEEQNLTPLGDLDCP